MSVNLQFTEASKTQNDVASVEVVAAATTTTAQETLAATGGESGRQVIVVLALIAMGVAALSLMRRRTI
jgi:LPXTG-motif cell wall-anchored protein